MSSPAIGPATSKALAQRGINPDFVPTRSVSEEVVQELSGRDWQGVSVLLPGSDIGRDVLAAGLTDLGAKVERISAYRTVTPQGASHLARQTLKEGVDVVTFTSGSTARNFVTLVQKIGLDPFQLPGQPKIACIGPKTARAAREAGFQVEILAEEYTIEGLVAAISTHMRKT